MAKSEKGVRTTGPQCDSMRTPGSMPAMKRATGESGERRAEQLDGGAETRAREEDISHWPKALLSGVLNLVEGKLKKEKKNYHRVLISTRLTQKKMERVGAQCKRKNVLNESLRETANEKKRGKEGQRRERGKAARRWRYETCVQKCSYGFARVVYGRVLEYARLKTFQL